MYGPKWPFLLMYGSHNMRHIGFPRVYWLSIDPRDLGRHNSDVLRSCGGFLGPVGISLDVFSRYLQKRRCVRVFLGFTKEEE